MKKSLFLLAILFIIINCNAQGVYIKVGGGYGFKSGAQNLNLEKSLSYFYINDFANYNEGENGEDNWENIYVSLGKGINFNGCAGYMFNKNIGFEFDCNYHLSSKYTATTTTLASESINKLSSKMLTISPSILIATDFQIIKPYTRLGFVLGFGSIEHYTSEKSNGEVSTLKVKLNGDAAKGFNAAVGTDYYFNEHFNLYCEAFFTSLTYKPNKAEMTEYTIDGDNLLSYYPDNFKKIELVDKYTEDTGSTNVESVKRLKQVFPYSSVGINIGLKYNF